MRVATKPWLFATALLLSGTSALAAASSPGDLAGLSLEELSALQVTSVSKRPEALSNAPSAIYVITADDIRRSGATNIPEVLRLAPNLEVAQLNSSQYTVTARGFNSPESANKLLVMIDGRSVYSPLGATVFWEGVSVPLGTIARIEVIGGPGGTLWGANAVNGVINIITTGAGDSLGGSVTAEAGSDTRDVTARYGFRLSDDTALRIYGTGFERDSTKAVSPTDRTHDPFNGDQFGFRLDGKAFGDTYSVSADMFDNTVEDASTRIDGGNVNFHWSHTADDGATTSAQAYFDRNDRTAPGLRDLLDTYDMQLQHNMQVGQSNALVMGAEYRLWHEGLFSTGPFGFAMPYDTLGIGNLFAQDTIALNRALALTLGLKIEYNNFTHFEYLPNARIGWQIDGADLVWASVSRAERTPSRIDRDLEAPGILAPSPTFQDEDLIAYELGYRGRIGSAFSISVSTFYNDYTQLRTDEFTNGGFPIVLGNGISGHSYGLESWAILDVAPGWRLKAGGNWLAKDFILDPGHTDLANFQSVGQDPAYQLQLRSEFTIGRGIDLDLALRRVGRIAVTNVPAYTEGDARLGWRFGRGTEISVDGFNLLHAYHIEVRDPSTAPPRYIARSVLLSVRQHF